FQPGRSLRRKRNQQTGCALIAAIQVAEEFFLKVDIERHAENPDPAKQLQRIRRHSDAAGISGRHRLVKMLRAF
ncbi:hypothetical protein, partial [Gluconobacter potus]|uniref:hypothetical protein n=1 Tax=Gluconobacter potus TaxID=2724927 RepID=UPI0039EC4E7A